MRMIKLDPTDESSIQQVAALLVEGFATNWPGAWPDLESGLAALAITMVTFGNCILW